MIKHILLLFLLILFIAPLVRSTEGDTNDDVFFDDEKIYHQLPLERVTKGQIKYVELDSDLVKIEDVSGVSKRGGKLLANTENNEKIFGDVFQINAKVKVADQEFTVQVDTGSTLMAIPMKGCNNCLSGRPTYDPKKSNNSALIDCKSQKCLGSGSYMPMCKVKGGNCDFIIAYGDGSRVLGNIYTDLVTLSGLSAMASFGANAQEYGAFEYPRADGIIGFGRSCAKCVPTIFEHIIKEQGLQNIFAMLIDDDSNGALSLGEINPNFYEGDIKYTGIVHPSGPFYNISTVGFKVGDKDYPAAHLASVIIDSGSTSLSLASPAYHDLVRHIKTNYCHIPGVCDRQGSVLDNSICYRTDQYLSMFPTLEFEFAGGVKVQVPPQNYFPAINNDDGKIYCWMIDKSNSELSIFGDVFMRGLYIIFDNENQRVGFSKARNNYNQSKFFIEHNNLHKSDGIILVKIPSAIVLILITIIYLTLSLF